MDFKFFAKDAPYPRVWLRVDTSDFDRPILELVTDPGPNDDVKANRLGLLEDSEDKIPDNKELRSQYAVLLEEVNDRLLESIAEDAARLADYNQTRGTFSR